MRIMLTNAVAVAALLLLSAGTARASTVELLNVKVPFPFMVGTQQLPAGQYVVQEDNDIGPAVLFIRGRNGLHSAMIETEPASGRSPAGEPALTFSRGEKQLRLSGVWERGNSGQTCVG